MFFPFFSYVSKSVRWKQARERSFQRRALMRSIALLKISVILGAFSAVLVLSPACKAQSEIAPDHFDGTDSWATTAQKVGPVKSHQMLAAGKANHAKPGFRTISRFTTKSSSSPPPHQIHSGILTRREAREQRVKQQDNQRHKRN